MKEPRVECFACGGTDIHFRHEGGGLMVTFPYGGVLVSCEDCGLTISLPFEQGRGTGKSELFKHLMAWMVRAGSEKLGERLSPPGEAKLDKLLAIMELEPPAANPCRCGALPSAELNDELLRVKCTGCGDVEFFIHCGRGSNETVVEANARAQSWWRKWNREILKP